MLFSFDIGKVGRKLDFSKNFDKGRNVKLIRFYPQDNNAL